jgi:hypothetical protein
VNTNDNIQVTGSIEASGATLAVYQLLLGAGGETITMTGPVRAQLGCQVAADVTVAGDFSCDTLAFVGAATLTGRVATDSIDAASGAAASVAVNGVLRVRKVTLPTTGVGTMRMTTELVQPFGSPPVLLTAVTRVNRLEIATPVTANAAIEVGELVLETDMGAVDVTVATSITGDPPDVSVRPTLNISAQFVPPPLITGVLDIIATGITQVLTNTDVGGLVGVYAEKIVVAADVTLSIASVSTIPNLTIEAGGTFRATNTANLTTVTGSGLLEVPNSESPIACGASLQIMNRATLCPNNVEYDPTEGPPTIAVRELGLPIPIDVQFPNGNAVFDSNTNIITGTFLGDGEITFRVGTPETGVFRYIFRAVVPDPKKIYLFVAGTEPSAEHTIAFSVPTGMSIVPLFGPFGQSPNCLDIGLNAAATRIEQFNMTLTGSPPPANQCSIVLRYQLADAGVPFGVPFELPVTLVAFNNGRVWSRDAVDTNINNPLNWVGPGGVQPAALLDTDRAFIAQVDALTLMPVLTATWSIRELFVGGPDHPTTITGNCGDSCPINITVTDPLIPGRGVEANLGSTLTGIQVVVPAGPFAVVRGDMEELRIPLGSEVELGELAVNTLFLLGTAQLKPARDVLVRLAVNSSGGSITSTGSGSVQLVDDARLTGQDLNISNTKLFLSGANRIETTIVSPSNNVDVLVRAGSVVQWDAQGSFRNLTVEAMGTITFGAGVVFQSSEIAGDVNTSGLGTIDFGSCTGNCTL